MKSIFSTMIILLSAVFASSQVQQAWVARANEVENKEEYGKYLALDPQGNVYVAAARYPTISTFTSPVIFQTRRW